MQSFLRVSMRVRVVRSFSEDSLAVARNRTAGCLKLSSNVCAFVEKLEVSTNTPVNWPEQ